MNGQFWKVVGTRSTSNAWEVFLNNFACTMKEGNLLYDKFNVSPQQPNLEVRVVVEKMISLNHRITILEDERIFFC